MNDNEQSPFAYSGQFCKIFHILLLSLNFIFEISLNFDISGPTQSDSLSASIILRLEIANNNNLIKNYFVYLFFGNIKWFIQASSDG